MRLKQIEVGDLFVIPLDDGRNAYGRYIFWDAEYGPLSQIFSYISESSVGVSEFLRKPLLFPPVFIGFGSVFKSGEWRILGSSPISNFVFPKFRSSFGRMPGEYHDWKIYDGRTLAPIGNLPKEYRSLEFLCAWSPRAIKERIATGRNRYDFIL